MGVKFGSGVIEFWTVARCRSFGAAAKELGVSQPVVSEAIKKLETAIGKRLIERTSRFEKLTPIGNAFYEHLKTLLPIFLDVQEKLVHGTLKKPGIEEAKARAEALFKPQAPGPVKNPKVFKPTPQLSDDVCLMKADGWEEEKIAAVIGISIELMYGVERIRRRALRQLDKAAKKGNTSATNAMLKLVGDVPAKFTPTGGITGGKLPEELRNPPKPKAEEPLGKKDQARLDALTADKDTGWETVVN
jgi:DNA-binding Lrp family transcriptional regulator